VSLFRRREPLHVRLAREGGLTGEEPRDPRPQWQETGVHGLPRAREWDATVSAEAPDLDGDTARFVALPDGTLLVEEGPDGLQPLADAVEKSIQPPYRARAARQDGDRWLVQARRIEVARLADAPQGEAIELTPDGLFVDGERSFGSVRELEGRGDVVRAERLDGDLWEIRTATL
jgi:hypothetical protein